jgi:hypothetical protein
MHFSFNLLRITGLLYSLYSIVSINWMKSASRWFHYTDILWCTVSKTLRKRRSVAVYAHLRLLLKPLHQIEGHKQILECDLWGRHERRKKRNLFLKLKGYSGMLGNCRVYIYIYVYIAYLNLLVTRWINKFNIQQWYALNTLYLCFVNSDLCHLQHERIGFYNRDEKCLQRGTDWAFK